MSLHISLQNHLLRCTSKRWGRIERTQNYALADSSLATRQAALQQAFADFPKEKRIHLLLSSPDIFWLSTIWPVALTQRAHLLRYLEHLAAQQFAALQPTVTTWRVAVSARQRPGEALLVCAMPSQTLTWWQTTLAQQHKTLNSLRPLLLNYWPKPAQQSDPQADHPAKILAFFDKEYVNLFAYQQATCQQVRTLRCAADADAVKRAALQFANTLGLANPALQLIELIL